VHYPKKYYWEKNRAGLDGWMGEWMDAWFKDLLSAISL
jgi:hypothetical protein